MPADRFETMRRTMVSNQLRTVAVDDPRIAAAMQTVARENFVPPARRDVAYADLPVPLENGRALNSPMATARLLNAAAIGAGDAVLIVGAATGYAAAVAMLVAKSVTALESDATLAALCAANVPEARVVTGSLADGIPDDVSAAGPFDAIVIDGAVETVPEALIGQLAPGGRLTAGVIERGVTRLAVGRRGGPGFALVPFADVDTVILPGFARPRAFVF